MGWIAFFIQLNAPIDFLPIHILIVVNFGALTNILLLSSHQNNDSNSFSLPWNATGI